ncbi:MAG: DUF885 domain-containing protein [Steroidobacteraceae bacterium]
MLLLPACHRAPVPATAAPAALASAPDPRAQAVALSHLIDRYWEGYLALNPTKASATGDRRFDAAIENDLAPAWLGDSLALERRALAELSSLSPRSLDAADLRLYEVFRAGREARIEGFLYPRELLPLDAAAGMPLTIARMGTGQGAHPFLDARGYEDWLRRIDAFGPWVEQAIANLREGQRRGYLEPRPLVERVVGQLATLARGQAEGAFLRPVQQFPASISAGDRDGLRARFTDAVRLRLLPACSRLEEFLRVEYLPRSRATLALSSLPLGEAWYAYLVREHTGSRMTPAQAQAAALAEVQRLHGHLQELAAQSGFAGNLPGFQAFIGQDPRFHFAAEAEMLDAARQATAQAEAAAGAVFDVAPAAAPAAALQVQPVAVAPSGRVLAGDGARLAILFVDVGAWRTAPRISLPALMLREGVPGRLALVAGSAGRASLSRWRRFERDAGFENAWSAYAVSLGEDMGLYADPYARIGATLEELRAALLAVADTGLQLRGWNRQQAIDYLREQMPIEPEVAAWDIDRCIAEPAAALAAPLGAARIRGWRARAQAARGVQFDLRAFHAMLLSEGSLPLDLLEPKVDRWLKTPVYNPSP